MNASINRLKIIFMAIFAVAVVAIWGYQLFWVWPANDCAKAGGWWDSHGRVCGMPIYIPSRTGRPAGMSREAWSKLQAERLVQGKISADPYAPPPQPKPTPAAKAPATPVPTPAPAEK